MKQAGLRIILLVGVLLAGIMGFAQAENSPAGSCPGLKPEQWVGHTFLFLDLPADKQAEGYEIFAEDQSARGFQGDRSVRISYAGHVGKQVLVTAVAPFPVDNKRYEYVVHLRETATGNKLVGRTTLGGQLEGLVLEEDLLKARRQFMGKTVYVKRRMLEGACDFRAKTVPEAVAVRIGDAVQVVDVYTGERSGEPIWLIVAVNGKKAILPIAYSWTNMPDNTWSQNPPWRTELFTENPRVKLGWSEAVWTQIEAGVVQEGMSKEQVRLSWGPPAFIDNRTGGEIWNYGTKVLKFTGDSLASIETVALKNAVMP